MKYITLLLLLPISLLAGNPSFVGEHSQITGRVLVENGSATLAFPGTEIVVRFTGSSLGLKGEVLGSGSYFNVTVDGVKKPYINLKQGSFEVTVAKWLDVSQEHTLRLVRRNEAWQGTVRLDEWVLVEGGELLAPEEDSRTRKIICIGDSITCGDSVDFYGDAFEGYHNANAEGSYGYELAKHFDAQVNLVSYGGKGIYRDWQGLTTEVRAHEFFERTLPDDPEPKWDHNSYVPDLVTICLGQNDFTQGVIPEEEYLSAYISFVKRIFELYPDTKIVLISSPMHGEHPASGDMIKRQTLEYYLAKVSMYFGQDKVRAHFVKNYPGTDWNAHPIAPQHKAIAEDLEPMIAEFMGW